MPPFEIRPFVQFSVDWLADHPMVYVLLLFCGLYIAYRCVRVVREEQQRERDEWDRQQIARLRASAELFERIRSVREGRDNSPAA